MFEAVKVFGKNTTSMDHWKKSNGYDFPFQNNPTGKQNRWRFFSKPAGLDLDASMLKARDEVIH
jgi:hypothetical protein